MTKNISKIMIAVNIAIISAVFVLNYFYQSNGFDFTLKCVCSGGFATLGVINLIYALASCQRNRKFYVSMAAGLILAMSGDVLIAYDFILGAAVFAMGHICFILAYCLLQKWSWLELAISAVLFTGSGAFLILCPMLAFDVPIFRAVCIVYALIICTMLGKAAAIFLKEQNAVNAIIAFASFLFFFSDLMLVLDRFIGRWSWTDEACMGTYYPALCLLAFSMYLKVLKSNKAEQIQ